MEGDTGGERETFCWRWAFVATVDDCDPIRSRPSMAKYEKAVVPAKTSPPQPRPIRVPTVVYFATKMLGTGGLAMPAPMWNPVWGGWL